MIELRNIYKAFNKGTVDEINIFEDFNFKLDEGDFVSVIGSNGSGKSTLLNLISGSVYPDSGQVLKNGEDISLLEEYKRSASIMRIFQDPSLSGSPKLTILENLALYDSKARNFSLRPAIKKNRLDEYKEMLSRLGMGLEDRLHDKLASLSGGQRQALMLVLAKLSGDGVLLLDEHTAALDPKAAETVMGLTNQLIKELKLSVVMVTHNLKHALSYGNRLVMLHKGKYIYNTENHVGKLKMDEVLNKFYETSIEVGNSV
ncbi:MAG: ATP-binding cassette domain-containing protein [Tissierellia bacterium]|nr:ATP-binding cassette domain-containing protein [Tissierellia bacterium]